MGTYLYGKLPRAGRSETNPHGQDQTRGRSPRGLPGKVQGGGTDVRSQAKPEDPSRGGPGSEAHARGGTGEAGVPDRDPSFGGEGSIQGVTPGQASPPVVPLEPELLSRTEDQGEGRPPPGKSGALKVQGQEWGAPPFPGRGVPGETGDPVLESRVDPCAVKGEGPFPEPFFQAQGGGHGLEEMPAPVEKPLFFRISRQAGRAGFGGEGSSAQGLGDLGFPLEGQGPPGRGGLPKGSQGILGDQPGGRILGKRSAPAGETRKGGREGAPSQESQRSQDTESFLPFPQG